MYEERLAGNYLLTVSPLRDSAENLVGSVHIGATSPTASRRKRHWLLRRFAIAACLKRPKDGILILDAETGAVHDEDPFWSSCWVPGESSWARELELGIFKDVAANQANFAELQRQEYIRYEDLPLEAADGRRVNVEFVSNVIWWTTRR